MSSPSAALSRCYQRHNKQLFIPPHQEKQWHRWGNVVLFRYIHPQQLFGLTTNPAAEANFDEMTQERMAVVKKTVSPPETHRYIFTMPRISSKILSSAWIAEWESNHACSHLDLLSSQNYNVNNAACSCHPEIRLSITASSRWSSGGVHYITNNASGRNLFLSVCHSPGSYLS